MEKKIPGTIFDNSGRWWWKVKLPGSAKRKSIPLKPAGAQYATKDRRLAEEIAKTIYQQALLHPGRPETLSPNHVRTVSELAGAYLDHARSYYRLSKEAQNIECGLALFLDGFGELPAEEIRPADLKTCRQTMIEHKLARSTINKRIRMIQRMFFWAVSEELLPASIAEPLRYISPLQANRSDAIETQPITPVAECHLQTILPFTHPIVQGMIQLQLLTGMRSGELCQMRSCDIDTSGKIWFYTPPTHKTKHHGHQRIIAIGPKGQTLLKPYLKRNLKAYCFRPSERRAGTGSCYDTASYRKAIRHAIKAARKAGKTVPDFHPHQIRHTAATRIRKEFGLDAARAVLGQRTLAMADEYAEIDQAKAAEAAEKLG